MGLFDFITGEDFRKSLEADFHEMVQCFNAEAWKAVHVLAGSIVEAVLIDYIVAEGRTSRDEALKMDLGTAINLCRDTKSISARTVDLLSVIKSYRNLIHPGRQIRLNEVTNRNSAEVAKALVAIVVEEIEKQRRDNYGYTAEQIVAKIERDSSVAPIVSHLVKKTNPTEVERLLIKVLPEAYSEYVRSEELGVIEHLERSFTLCFRTAFDQASDALKKRVAERFVEIIKEESDWAILGYGQLFFRASDLQYLATDDIDLVKKYLLDRLENSPSEWLTTVSGISRFVSSEEVVEFIDPLVRAINDSQRGLSEKARDVLIEDWLVAPSEIMRLAENRLEEWIAFYRKKGLTTQAERIEQVKAIFEDIETPM
jgi:hypothetical protein